MDIKVNKNNEGFTAIPNGKLDANGSVSLQNVMDEILKEGANVKVVIDFSSVPFASSSGLRVLLLAMKKINAAGGSLELQNVSDNIKEIFNVTGFSSILRIV